jgi:hypothetical protein
MPSFTVIEPLLYTLCLEYVKPELEMESMKSRKVAWIFNSAKTCRLRCRRAGREHNCLDSALRGLARAQAGVNAGPHKRTRQRYVPESTMELGSIYGILAKQAPASRGRQDWEAARSALHQAISQLEAVTAGGKLTSVDAADRQRAQNVLAEAEEHLSASLPTRP